MASRSTERCRSPAGSTATAGSSRPTPRSAAAGRGRVGARPRAGACRRSPRWRALRRRSACPCRARWSPPTATMTSTCSSAPSPRRRRGATSADDRALDRAPDGAAAAGAGRSAATTTSAATPSARRCEFDDRRRAQADRPVAGAGRAARASIRDAALGQPLTSLFRLIEEADGAMPLLAAVATRGAVDGQRAVPRGGGRRTDRSTPSRRSTTHGRFAGFHARVCAATTATTRAPSGVDRRSRNRSTRRCARRSTGSSPPPTISSSAATVRCARDYATYASDIAAAGAPFAVGDPLDGRGRRGGERSRSTSRALAAEAVGTGPAAAPTRAASPSRSTPPTRRCRANGEARAVVQILVNILGNAVRHSPDGRHGRAAVRSDARRRAAVTVADQGPGIAPADQQRIFERYRAGRRRARRQRARPRHLAPPGAVDGRRHHARQRARRGRALHPDPAGGLSASARRPAHSRAAVAPT